MRLLNRVTLLAAASAIMAACSQGSQGPPNISKANPGSPNYSKLQLAVGTANLYGTSAGLNVVSTLRQPNGDSAVGVDTPSLTGPFSLPPTAPAGSGIDQYSTLPSGPSAFEAVAGNNITGTPQTVRPGTPVCDQATTCADGTPPNTTTFGQSGGVFGLGLAPFNHTNSGTPVTYTPYSEPLYDTSGNSFVPWGGPPAFDPNHDGMGTRDGTFNLGVKLLGVAEGLTTFAAVTARAGQYNLNVVVPTGINSSGQSSFATLTANATLASTALLPTLTAPALASNGRGGGIFTISLPPGVTEGYIQVTDYGPGGAPGATTANCQGATGTMAFAVYYTVRVVAGSLSYTLPDNDGPNLASGGGVNKPSPTLCTVAQNSAALGASSPGDSYMVQLIGFDYPMYAASYPNSSGNQAPVIAGSNGQADITISAPASASSP